MKRRSLGRMFVWSGVAIAVMLIASPAQPLAQAKINVSGQWVLDVQTDQGGGSPTFVFKQDGEKLTGKYSGLFGEAEITGTVKGQSINFSFSGDAQGTAVKVTYEGTVESNDSMKGKVDLGGVGQGTFTGKRVK